MVFLSVQQATKKATRAPLLEEGMQAFVAIGFEIRVS
jgi:hypothetical protein